MWIAVWAVVTIVGLLGTIASVNNVRFGRRVSAEIKAVAAGAREPARVDARQLPDLPAPVARYGRKALPRPTVIRTVHLRHGGRFRPSLDGSWLPIRGEQFFRVDPPAFVWWGRVRVAPGMWIDARDRSVDGSGNMLVMPESTFTLADSTGPQLDQGALLRLLAEMAWFPTAFFDTRYVRWAPVDDRRAAATLRVADREATATFEFGPDDLPAAVTAERYRDLGGGRAALTPFLGRCADYRSVDGVLVPHRMIASWVINGHPVEYVDFLVEQLEFDRPVS